MPNLRAQTLARAAHILGGADALAEELAIPVEVLGAYLRADLPVPTDIFLRATEFVTDASVADAANAPKPDESAPSA